jgi:outer membrane protein assembly factor BamB
MSRSEERDTPRRSVRLWPVLVVLGGGLGWLAYVWLLLDGIRQERVVATLATFIVVSLLLLAWLLLLSRLPWRTRLLVFGLVALLAAAAASLVRVRGVSGDLVPILAFRWTAEPAPSPVPRAAGPPEPASVPTPTSPGPRADAPSGKPGAAAAVAAARSAAAGDAAADATSGGAAARAGSGPGHEDYPQFLGPGRDATLKRLRLARDWTARPPRRLWRQRIGAGWSAFAVAGDAAVTQEQLGPEERVVRYDLRSGRVVWAHADRARYESVVAGEGPRATPTVSGGRVFTVGSTGLLNALDLETGRLVWSRHVVEENGGRVPGWGKSCSPLALGGLVVVSAGGPDGRSLVAYRQDSGEPAWAAGDDRSAYSSPALVRLAGRDQILIFNEGSVAAHDPETGAVLWEHAWPATQPNVSQPVLLPGDRVLFSSGYGIGSKLFHVSSVAGGALEARLVWESPRLKAKFTNVVFHDGSVYGLDDGVLTCLDPETGERRWKAGRYGHGQVILAGGLLLVQTEEGEIVLVEADPRAHTEVARFPALDGKTWNPPALAAPYLLVRNDREAACYELPVEGP